VGKKLAGTIAAAELRRLVQAQRPRLEGELEPDHVPLAKHAGERAEAGGVGVVAGAVFGVEPPQEALLLKVEAKVAGLGVSGRRVVAAVVALGGLARRRG